MSLPFRDIRRCEARDEWLLAELAGLWEDSVRATHLFLAESDICRIRPQVKDALALVPELLVISGDDGRMLAFAGVEDDSLEMLFVRPDCFGCGIGSMLLEYAVTKCGVVRLCVNEDNPRAADFYRSHGFETVGRREVDDLGNEFPLLMMENKDYRKK